MQQGQVQFSHHPPLISAIKSQECLQQAVRDMVPTHNPKLSQRFGHTNPAPTSGYLTTHSLSPIQGKRV